MTVITIIADKELGASVRATAYGTEGPAQPTEWEKELADAVIKTVDSCTRDLNEKVSFILRDVPHLPKQEET